MVRRDEKLYYPMQLLPRIDNGSNEPASTLTIAVIQTDTPLTLITTTMRTPVYKSFSESHKAREYTLITNRITNYLAQHSVFEIRITQIENIWLKLRSRC